MASKKGKSRKVHDDNLDEEQHMDMEDVEVNFEARNAEDCDFHGIKKLLQQLFLKANVDLSELSNTLISQNYVGSVITQVPLSDEDDDDGDDDVFGVISVVNISTDNKHKVSVANDIKKYLREKCTECDKSQQEQFNGLLENGSNQLGFLINERFMNIPPEIALPSFESLLKEIEKAQSKGMKYNFTHYILVCKMVAMPALEEATAGKKKKAAKAEAWPKVYVNGEEEFFADESCLQWDFCVRDERDLESVSDDMQPWRRVVILPAARMPNVMTKLRQHLAQT